MQILAPFNKNTAIGVKGDILIKNSEIEVYFELTDPQHKAIYPSTQISMTGENIQRQCDLWKTTCFEIFLAGSGSKDYYEVNLSPKGAWDAYKFSDYRDPQPPVRADAIEILQLNWNKNSLQSTLRILDGDQNWSCGLCAVIEDKTSTHHYFSLVHPSSRPDFHIKESFTLRRNNL